MSETFKPNFDKNGQEPKNEAGRNVYDKEKFSPETAKDHVELLVADFKGYYSLLGYKEEPPVQISSGVDPTVRFIGSHVSVFKPYLGENNVPTPGIFMRQNCLRTRNADKLLDDDYFPNWGSYFPSIGAITPPERLDEACDETFNFFDKRLAISPENLLIRISSADTDLIDACKQHYGENNLEIDSRKPEYYRHNIGMEGVRGRNFNIALRNPNAEGFADIGNIILLEDAQKQLRINREKATRNNTTHQYLLRGHIRCRQCGHAYTGGADIKKRKIDTYHGRLYRCMGKKRDCSPVNPCKNKGWGADKLEENHLEKV